jgi:NADPH-dependent glutamate synthase beta subunit-like oxidoreductase
VEEEVLEYMKESVPGDRIEPADLVLGLSREQVMAEAARCMHCDCRDLVDCKLRKLSDEYKANQKRYWSEERKKMVKNIFSTISLYMNRTNASGAGYVCILPRSTRRNSG